MSERQLDDWLDTYQSFTSYSEAPASYHTWTAISCIAAALQRKVHLPWGYDILYPNEYIILVGPSGKARKGQAINIGRSLVEELTIPTVGEDNTQEAVIVKMKESLQQFEHPDGSIRFHCSVSCFAEELAVFTGYQNTTYLAYLTNWYDSRDKWTRKTKHQGTDEIQGMCFNLLGATAPDWIPHILSREAIGGGFTSRVLFVVEDGRRFIQADPREMQVDLVKREALTHDLEHINTLTGPFDMAEPALQFYINWYEKDDKDLLEHASDLLDGTFQGYVSRRATHLRKLSMVCSISRSDTLTIEEEDIKRALLLLTGIETNMASVFSGVGRNKYAEDVKNIAAYIQKKGEVTKAQLLRIFYRDLSENELEDVTSMLVGMNAIDVVRKPSENTTIYKINGYPSIEPAERVISLS